MKYTLQVIALNLVLRVR